jgi:hypothetical protein
MHRRKKQYWEWMKFWLPGGGPVYTFGLAAICLLGNMESKK